MSNAQSHIITRQLPGSLGLWIFIFSDLMLFGLYFALLVYDMTVDSSGYAASQATLSRTLGLFNTLLLLTGSWSVVMGTRVEKDPPRAARYLQFAAIAGFIFLIVKAVEYAHLLEGGHNLVENRFYIWYFFLTGYHAIHVLAGCMLLLHMASRLARHSPATEEWQVSAGCYWHLVDLLWIGIFSLAYLL